MILQLGIPGQLAGLKTAVENLVESGLVSDVPGSGSTANTAGYGRAGFLAASAVTSTSYIDAVDVSGAGILYFAMLTIAGEAVGYLRLEVDGETFTERSLSVSSGGVGIVCGLGAAEVSGSTSDGHYTAWPPLLIPVPYRTGFKLQAKRTSGTGTVTPRYIYIPYTLGS